MEAYGTELSGVDDLLPKVNVVEPELAVVEELREETDVILEKELYYGVNEPEVVELPYEPINKSYEAVDEAYEALQNVSMADMTKERYEALTKKRWNGLE